MYAFIYFVCGVCMCTHVNNVCAHACMCIHMETNSWSWMYFLIALHLTFQISLICLGWVAREFQDSALLSPQ